MIGKLTASTPSLRAKRSNPWSHTRGDGLLRRFAPLRKRFAFVAGNDGCGDAVSGRLVAEIRLDRAVHLDRQRVAVAVLGVARGDAHPALADAVLLDIGFLDALEADADIAREDVGVVIRAVRIDRKTVGEFIVHRFVGLVHSSASMSFLSPSGVAVGA